jgi:hypothetical protein
LPAEGAKSKAKAVPINPPTIVPMKKLITRRIEAS